MASANSEEPDTLGWLAVALVIWAGLAWYLVKQEKLATQSPQDETLDSGAGDDTGENDMIYNPKVLTKAQRANADLIVDKAQAADLDAAFMLALAVTESSLRAGVVGDDGKSVGLFQMNKDYLPGETLDTLKDPDHNTDLAVLALNKLLDAYPGHTWADYAEAWTLGGAGRFVKGRRNPTKVKNMARAISDLRLDLDLSQVPA